MRKILNCVIIIFFISLLNNAIIAQNPILHFDGVDDYVDLGQNAGNGIRTIELWFKLDQEINSELDEFSTLIAREISSSNNYNEFQLSFQPYYVDFPGCLRFDIDGTQPFKSVYSDDDTWNADQWYHVAAIIHPEDGMMLFINGHKQASTHSHNQATTNYSSYSTTIGCWGNAFVRYFEGCIDDVRFSSEALYTSNFIPPCPDLLATSSTTGLWNFNESVGNIAIDSSSNAYNGQIYGATRDSSVICTNALSFDGIDDYVNLGAEAGNGVRTIELWFKPKQVINPQLNDVETLVAREINGSNNMDEFSLSFQPYYFDYPGQLRFDIDNTPPFKSVYSDSNIWNVDQWYHVAAVIHPLDGMMLFIDGVKQSSTHSYNEQTGNSSSISTIGCLGNSLSGYFEGCIDDVRFSANVIYNSNFAPPCPDLKDTIAIIGLWNFNENSGTVAIDSSGNSNNGQIIGATRIMTQICEDPIITEIDDKINDICISINVYPNPSKSDFQFELPNTEYSIFVVDIYNSFGHKVFSHMADKSVIEIKLNYLPKGIYFYHIRNDSRVIYTGKLIKN